MAIDVKREVEAIRRGFRAVGDAERAEREKAYHKSALRFHGVDAKTIEAAAAEFRRGHPKLSRDEAWEMVDALWGSGWFDLRSVALSLAWRYRKLLASSDIERFEAMLRESKGWAHVDWMSTRHVAELLERDPGLVARLRAWAKDEDFWIRRASMLALLPALRRGEGDFELFSAFASSMIDEKEFFIRKAIGWILREVSKQRPGLAHGFLETHIDRVSGLTLREGAKYLSEEQRERLLARTRRQARRA